MLSGSSRAPPPTPPHRPTDREPPTTTASGTASSGHLREHCSWRQMRSPRALTHRSAPHGWTTPSLRGLTESSCSTSWAAADQAPTAPDCRSSDSDCCTTTVKEPVLTSLYGALLKDRPQLSRAFMSSCGKTGTGRSIPKSASRSIWQRFLTLPVISLGASDDDVAELRSARLRMQGGGTRKQCDR